MWDATNNSLLVKRKGSKINKRRSKIEEMEGTGRWNRKVLQEWGSSGQGHQILLRSSIPGISPQGDTCPWSTTVHMVEHWCSIWESEDKCAQSYLNALIKHAHWRSWLVGIALGSVHKYAHQWLHYSLGLGCPLINFNKSGFCSSPLLYSTCTYTSSCLVPLLPSPPLQHLTPMRLAKEGDQS